MNKQLVQTIILALGVLALALVILFSNGCKKEDVKPFSTEPIVAGSKILDKVKKMPKPLPNTVTLRGKKLSKAQYKVRKNEVALKYKNFIGKIGTRPNVFEGYDARKMVELKQSLCPDGLTITDDRVKQHLMNREGDGAIYISHMLNKEDC